MLSSKEIAKLKSNIGKLSPEQMDNLLRSLNHGLDGETPTGIPYKILEMCQRDPVFYAREVLKIDYLTNDAKHILRSLNHSPRRVFVKAGHAVGKSHLAAISVNWWFDCFCPSTCYTVSPTKEHVTDVLWKEVRMARQRAGRPDHFIGPAAPCLRISADHFAKGLTASTGESFHGRHDPKTLFVFDESVGLEPFYFYILNTMFKEELGHSALSLCNPTTTTCQAYAEDLSGKWNVISISAMDHPNIQAGLEKKPLPVPYAVNLSMLETFILDWALPIKIDEVVQGDFCFPPNSGKWYRPMPEFQSRVLGMWPKGGTYGVWSEYLFERCVDQKRRDEVIPVSAIPQLGCDVGRTIDFTSIHTRWDKISLSHHSYQGLRVDQSAAAVKDTAHELADIANSSRKESTPRLPPINGKQIPLKIDDANMGGGVVDILLNDGYLVIPINAATQPMDKTRYPNKRSELWFQTARKAEHGLVNLSRIDKQSIEKIRRECMAPKWENDAVGRRVVERKEATKSKIGHSPDNVDAMNLCYYDWESDTQVGSFVENDPKVRMFTKHDKELTWEEQDIIDQREAGERHRKDCGRFNKFRTSMFGR